MKKDIKKLAETYTKHVQLQPFNEMNHPVDVGAGAVAWYIEQFPNGKPVGFNEVKPPKLANWLIELAEMVESGTHSMPGTRHSYILLDTMYDGTPYPKGIRALERVFGSPSKPLHGLRGERIAELVLIGTRQALNEWRRQALDEEKVVTESFDQKSSSRTKMAKPKIGARYRNHDWDVDEVVLAVREEEADPNLYKDEYYATPNTVYQVTTKTVSECEWDGGPELGSVSESLWSEKIYELIEA